MVTLPIKQGIPRFKFNEERLDKFVNGPDNQDWQTDGGVGVPTLRKFLKQSRADIDTFADDIEAAAEGMLQQPNWAALAATPGVKKGQPGRSTGPDAGTHTDPVTGATVPNEGEFSWSVSPAGWRRVGNRSVLSLETELENSRGEFPELVHRLNSSDTEIENSRGEFPELVHRLNNVDATLDLKAAAAEDLDTFYYNGHKIIYAWTADDYTFLFGITEEGMLISPVNADLVDDPTYTYTIAYGQSEQIALGIRRDGKRTYIRGWEVPCTFPDLTHFSIYGQSNAGGGDSLPVVSGELQNMGNVTFARGVQTWSSFGVTPQNRNKELFVLTPLYERNDGVGRGEMFSTGLSAQLKVTGVGGRYAPAHLKETGPHFLFSNASTGGRFLVELTPEDPTSTGHFLTFVDDMVRAKVQADLQGYTYGVGGFFFSQGEAESGTKKMSPVAGSPVLTIPNLITAYETMLIGLHKSMQTAAQTVSGQTRPIPMFIAQTAMLHSGDAQVFAAEKDPDIYLATPSYFGPNAANSTLDPLLDASGRRHGADIHRTADASRWIGEHLGKVARKVLTEGEDWQPLKPIDVSRISDTVIDIKFYVPKPPLQFDDTWVQPVAHRGFEVYPGTPDAPSPKRKILSVAIVAPDVVRIELDPTTPVTAGSAAFVTYGATTFSGTTSIGPTVKRAGEVYANGNPSTELVFDGDILAEITPRLRNGAFDAKQIGGQALRVRDVRLEGGKTVIRGETPESAGSLIINGVMEMHLLWTAGNLYDSDPSLSIYKFADTSYGVHAGKYYPLNNYCVVFSRTVRT